MKRLPFGCDSRTQHVLLFPLHAPLLSVPYVKVAPEDILKVQFPRFTTLDLRPTNTDISLAVAGLLTFYNSTTACLICAQADCLLNLEQLLRQFLISKETLSVRMLDESQDPTPLLKEIRDDKTATIIVDANATMSHIILERASELGMLSVYYTYIFTSLRAHQRNTSHFVTGQRSST
uniref:Receptor ligand binding region domain-containing protein n=1 Tax=Knipowitschia caucasica TaxID=637954 RepID=A0AAV2J3H7_KNICA